MILGLRKIDGVCIEKYKDKFNENPLEIYKNEIKRLEDLKLIECTQGFIKLTRKGLDFANIVWEEFV